MGGKLKTNKSVAKRIRVTKSGKFKKGRAGRRHLLQGKSAKRRRHLRSQDLVSPTHEKHIRRLLPYAKS
jgi:large subunit ribosomal protein L35